jgi:hypothetical protein
VSRVVRFRQADISRAVKGAKAAGISVSQIEIGSDGRIVLISRETQASQTHDDMQTGKQIAMRVQLKGVFHVRKKMADGEVRDYWYACIPALPGFRSEAQRA